MLREIYQNFKAGQRSSQDEPKQVAARIAAYKLKKSKEVLALEREVLVALKRLKDRINEMV
jgi:hypothetical protein|tara:strand:+ start:370 stop:552 length:183 start_codon:yes stop_codon:yes gene_type:complete